MTLNDRMDKILEVSLDLDRFEEDEEIRQLNATYRSLLEAVQKQRAELSKGVPSSGRELEVLETRCQRITELRHQIGSGVALRKREKLSEKYMATQTATAFLTALATAIAAGAAVWSGYFAHQGTLEIQVLRDEVQEIRATMRGLPRISADPKISPRSK